jgi:hypothetical protein
MRRGRWFDPAKSWHDTNFDYCDVCGRLIPRRRWIFDNGKDEVIACGPDCEDLYTEYVKPTYGAKGKHADFQR